MLILTFKYIKNMCPYYLCDQFNFVHNFHDHTTRNLSANTLIVPNYKSNSGKRAFLVKPANFWNNVPPSIRLNLDNLTLYQFKTNVFTSALKICLVYHSNDVWICTCIWSNFFLLMINDSYFYNQYVYFILYVPYIFIKCINERPLGKQC